MGKLLERRKAVHHFGNLPGNGTVEHCSMSSDVLGVNKDFSIYLPNGYEDCERRYPVLYLFHPAGGTHEMLISSTVLSAERQWVERLHSLRPRNIRNSMARHAP